MKNLTWSDFTPFKPCYSPQDKYGDFRGTILDILNDARIPDSDKIWAATRKGILSNKTLRLFACASVREVWHLLIDESSKKAVEVAEQYASGDADAAAGDAARDAADSTAKAAVRAAADAAWEAAWEDAWDAARAKQIKILINLIQ